MVADKVTPDEVKQTTDHAEAAITKRSDLSQLIQDLQKDQQKRGSHDKTLEEAVTKALHDKGYLPNVDIEGVDNNGRLVLKHKDGRTFTVDRTGQTRLEGRVERNEAASQDARAGAPTEATRPVDNHVTRDAQGRVIKVEYPANNKTQEFTRNEKGEIIRVKNEDNEVWNLDSNTGTWTMEGSNPPITWKGKLYTTDNGDFVKEFIDGRKDVERADGSTVSYDKNGRVTSTEDAYGHVRTFKYDSEGKLSEIKGPGEEFYKTTDGGKTWEHSFGPNKGGMTGELDVKVDPKTGDVSYKSGLGDGRIIEKVDGSEVRVNDKGQVTRIEDAKGKVFEFGYDQNGKLNRVVNEHGTWTSKDGHEWTNEKGEKWAGKVSVDAEGNYWYESDSGKRTWNRPDGTKATDQRPAGERAAGERPGDKPPEPGDRKPPEQPQTRELPDGRKITHYPDGFKVVDYPDGSQVEINEKGQVTYVRNKEGYSREFHYGPDGKIDSVKGMDGQTWVKVGPNQWRSDGGQTWRGEVIGVDEHGNAHYKPERGRPFVLTREGRVMPEGAADGDAHSRHRPGGQRRPEGGKPPQGADRPPQQGEKPPETDVQRREREAKERAAEERRKGPQVKPETFYPKKGVYNPVAPPGVGDSQPGKAHEGEFDTGEGNIGIDWRKAETKDNGDGTVTHTYEGELEDSGLMPWNWGDTNYKGSEKWTKDGRLLERHAEYDGGVDMKFKTPEGEKEIANVTKVETRYNPQTGNYDTVITTEDGTKYRAETAADGSVKSFKEVTGQTQTDTAGDRSANVGSFSPSDGQYNPVRPKGLGELKPGQASSGEKNGIDWRESRAENNPDGSTTYRYSGELEDSGLMPWNWGDTNFEASETVDKDGNLVESHISYDSAVDQQFVGPNGEKVEIEDVKKVDTTRDKDGNYVTKVTDDDGKVHTFVTNSKGKVVSYQKPS